MIKPRYMAPDWPELVCQMLLAGMTKDAICQRADRYFTTRMINHYCQSRVQPIYHNGEALIRVWCQVTGLQREQVPLVPVHKPYRLPRSCRAPEPVQVPQFPVLDERELARRIAEARGIAVDGRWGLARIRSEIEAAEAVSA